MIAVIAVMAVVVTIIIRILTVIAVYMEIMKQGLTPSSISTLLLTDLWCMHGT
jgi:hypothetical protein